MSNAPSHLSQSKFSFKVLTECPIIIALLFQLYRAFVTNNVPHFVTPIISGNDYIDYSLDLATSITTSCSR